MFPALAPLRPPPGIDLRCCDVREIVALRGLGATLVHADPPWVYAREAGAANPETYGIYGGMAETDIVAVLALSVHLAAPGARLLTWTTWPKLGEWWAAGLAGPGWEYVSGGAWMKAHHVGVGYHWRGHTEPALLFTRPGTSGRAREMLGNGHYSRPEEHSRKPLEFLRAMVRAWTDPGDLVVDLWAGLAPMAAACKIEGRRYLGAEIDPHRHGLALSLLRSA